MQNFGSMVWVALGGAVGSVLRFAVGQWCGNWTYFAWATWTVNIVACFVLGMLWQWQERGVLSASMGWLLATGFCGGFSTFSTFSKEVLQLIIRQQMVWALWYVVMSVVVGVLAVYIGAKCAHIIR